MRLLAWATACAVATAALVTPPALAATTPTISGPADSGFDQSVVISGTTPQPDEAVSVYFRPASRTTYSLGAQVVSDSSGHWAITHDVTISQSYYAVSGGARSAAASTYLRNSRCTVGGSPFTTTVLPNSLDREKDAFTYTARGVWYGYAVSPSDFRIAVISWYPGQTRPTVLGVYTPKSFAIDDSDRNAVQFAGSTPSGAVVAAIANGRSPHLDGYWGWVYDHGKAYQLHKGASWTSVRPVAVLPNGSIVGAAVSQGQTYIVSWSNPRAHAQVVRHDPEFYNRVTSSGDAIDLEPKTGFALSDTANRRRILDDKGEGTTDGSVVVRGEQALTRSQSTNRILGWDLTSGPTGPIEPSFALSAKAPVAEVKALGADGLFLAQAYRGPDYVASLDGGLGYLPPLYGWEGTLLGEAIDSTGLLAAVLAKDQRIHFLRCW